MFNFFANAFGYVLNAIYNLVNNYGVAIIIFTIILKLLMLPISIKQQKTLKKSAKIQEKSKELQEKYSSDQVRLIIILSIFYLVSRPLTYMKHIDAETINNYTTELSQNGERINYPEIAIIKKHSAQDERVRLNMDFLGLNLSDVPSQNYSDIRVFIIPVLYVITSLISMKITTNMSKKEKSKNEIENKEKKQDDEIDAMEEMNKNMSLMMPIMSVSIALIAPLGLALYWLVSNILMIAERIVINKFFKKDDEEEV